jgi:hypothetical protein
MKKISKMQCDKVSLKCNRANYILVHIIWRLGLFKESRTIQVRYSESIPLTRKRPSRLGNGFREVSSGIKM